MKKSFKSEAEIKMAEIKSETTLANECINAGLKEEAEAQTTSHFETERAKSFSNATLKRFNFKVKPRKPKVKP